MSVKLYEIARAAGVSVSTVSRVLNSNQDNAASKATTERIFKAACDLGYYARPSVPAAVNGGQKPGARSLICFLTSPSATFNDYFFSQVLAGIQKEAGALGYSITHTLSTSSSNAEIICSNIREAAPDGVILMGRISKKIMKLLNNDTVNLIYAGLNKLNVSIDQVICDGYTAILDAISYLAKCGFHHIGYIGTIPSEKSDILNEHRFQAFSHGLKLNNLKLNMEFCKNIEFGTEQAYNAVVELIREGKLPEAFCCTSGNAAIGVISALNDYQFRVPEDISVIGLDDTEMAKFMRPRLTSFNMQTKELGRFAVKILDDRIKGDHSAPLLVQFPSTLIIRDSCMEK